MTISVIDVIDLIHYRQDAPSLHGKLKTLFKEEFKPNERIVVLHNDTDFYFLNSPLSFTIYNLLLAIKSMGFPGFVFRFICNSSNLKKQLIPYFDNNDQPEVFNLILNYNSYNNVKDIIRYRKNIIYPMLCMVGLLRAHREKLIAYIIKNNCSEIQYSINNPNTKMLSEIPTNQNQSNIDDNLDYVYNNAISVSEDWTTLTQNKEILFLNQIPVPKSYINPNIPPNGSDFYKEFAVDLVSESVFDYPSVYISEKILRPILCTTPFIILGAVGTIRYLQSFGIKTFDDYWDESYDSIEDPSERFLAVMKQAEIVSKWPLDYLKQINLELESRLLYNRQIILDYIDQVFKPIYKEISDNVQNKNTVS